MIAGSVASEAGRQSAQHVTTDERGEASLPPLRNGELIVEATADGYARSEPVRRVVDAEHHEIDIELIPLAMAGSLRLTLANGAPAAQADIWAFDPGMQPVWRGTASGDGALDLPEVARDAWLIIRHPNAASTIRRWSSSQTTWTLGPAAEPLTITAEPASQIVVWLDGVKLAGPALAFAAWSTPAANPEGTWIGRNLPSRPIEILAIPFADRAEVPSRAYDAVAHRIDYPWPGRVSL